MMGTARTITWGDVERYQRLRETDRKLMNRVMKTVPRVAFEEIGAALGVMRKGVLVFDSDSVISVLADCCVHDWIKDGKNVVTKFSLAHPASPGSDEEYLLRAHQLARYRLLISESIARGAGLECVDALSMEHLFIMDVNFSISAKPDGPLLATRTVPLDGYWMTTGVGLPVGDKQTANAVMREVRPLGPDLTRADPHKLALTIIRACLDCGAAEHVRYEGADEEDNDLLVGFEDGDSDKPQLHRAPSPRARASRRAPGRNDPCPCGSGKKYKRCCLLK
jgi:hypothetical protein